MTQQKLETEIKPAVSWDDVGARKPKAEWKDDTLVVTFKHDKPNEMDSKFDGRKLWLFDVTQDNKECVFMTSSLRLAKALKGVGNLADRTLKITRSGKGTGTQYTAEAINEVPAPTEEQVTG